MKFLSSLQVRKHESSSLYHRPAKQTKSEQDLDEAKDEILKLQKIIDFLLESCEEAGIEIKPSLLDGFTASPPYITPYSFQASSPPLSSDSSANRMESESSEDKIDGMESLDLEQELEMNPYMTQITPRSISPLIQPPPPPTPTNSNFNIFNSYPASLDSTSSYSGPNFGFPDHSADSERHINRFYAATAELNRWRGSELER